MRRTIACLFLLVAVPVLANEPGTLTIRDFSAGLVTSKDPSIIPDGAAQDMENVDVDEGSIVKRKGSILVNTTAIGADNSVRFLHEYVDPTNSFWLLAVSSNTLYGSTDGGASFAVLTSVKGISSTSRFQAANAFGKAYLVDGSTNAITFDGTTVAHNTNVPLGGVTAFFAGRLWVANGSNLYGSRMSDADDWTNNGVDDADAFSAVVRNNDGYTITALKTFGPDLFVFKAKSIDRVVITGGGTDFNLYPVTSHLGTTHPDSVRATDNAIVWLAQDGYYSFDGSQIRRISDAITPTVEGITQLDALTRSYSETDMTTGTDNGTSGEIVGGTVRLAEGTKTDGSAGDFASGTKSASLEIRGNNYLALDLDSSASVITNYKLDTRLSASTALGWTFSGSWSLTTSKFGDVCGVEGPALGTYFAVNNVGADSSRSFNDTTYLDVMDASAANVLATQNLGRFGYDECYIKIATTTILSSFVGKTIRLRIRNVGASSYALTDAFLSSGKEAKIGLQSLYEASLNNWYNIVDYVTDEIQSTVSSGTFTSQTLSVSGVTNPGWDTSVFSLVENGHNVDVSVQSSTNGVNWGAAQSWSASGTVPPLTSGSQYFRYVVDFTTTTTGNAEPFFRSVSFSARELSGSYTSPDFSMVGFTSWLQFNAIGVADGGSLSYSIYADTDSTRSVSDATTFVSSQTIVSGQTPSISTSTYIFLVASMTTTGTETPYLDSWTAMWGEGTITNLVSSEFYNQKYYSAISLGGGSNDTILVFDQNGAWTKYTGLEPYFLAKYRTNMLMGVAGAGDVVRLEEKDRYRDYDDAEISAFWLSKDFDMGYPLTTKSAIRYYLTGKRSVGGNVTFGYGVDRGSLTSASYALDAYPGFFRQVIKPTSLQFSEGLQHRFRVSDDTLDGAMSVLSITGQWRKNTNP